MIKQGYIDYDEAFISYSGNAKNIALAIITDLLFLVGSSYN